MPPQRRSRQKVHSPPWGVTSRKQPQNRKYMTFHCCQKQTEPRPRVMRTENFVKCGHGFWDMQVDRQTQTWRTQYFAPLLRCRGGATSKAFGLAISRSRVQILLEATLRNNLRQVVYTFVPLSPSSITWCSAAGEVTAGLVESNGSLPPGGWLMVTCRLTACTPGSAPGPTLGIEYGKPLPFTFLPGVK